MLTYALAWLIAAIAFLALDALWFSQMVQRFYKPIIREIMRPGFNLPAAAAFYVIYVCGIIYFAVRPALDNASLGAALLNGALFGFFAYATFNLTNHAVLRVWSTRLTIVDIAWGTFATAVASGIAYEVASRVS